MSTVSIRLPDSLHRKLRDIATQEGVSIGQLIAAAAAEKVRSIEFFEQRTRLASREAFDLVLSRVPKVPPMPGDELPPGWVSPLRQPQKVASRRRKRVRSK